MFSYVRANLPVLLNRFAWFFAVMLLGYTIHAKQVWPHPIIDNGVNALEDLSQHAKSYLGFFPTRSAFYEPGHYSGVTIHKVEKTAPGLVFLAGIVGKRNVMKLMTASGRELHRWTVPFYRAIPKLDHVMPVELRPLNESMTHIHGAHVFPDGSVVFNFDFHGLVSIDACGKVQWVQSRMAHHAVTKAEDGTIWVLSRKHHSQPIARLPLLKAPFYEDTLLQVSRGGEVLREISLPEVFAQNDLHALASATGTLSPENQNDDFMHTNDIEILTQATADAFPMFSAGDMALSMRDLNLVLVLDPETEKVKWHQTGPWLRQHDPDFLEDGTISVFDNRWGGVHNIDRLGGSRIIKIDPQTRRTTTVYQSKRGQPRFFTHIMGVHQTLKNGNVLIAEPTRGRVFEVSPKGEIVWQYINRLNSEYLGHVTVAQKLPADYFTFKPGNCNNERAAS